MRRIETIQHVLKEKIVEPVRFRHGLKPITVKGSCCPLETYI